jgi:hypothetical protein
MAGSVIVDKGQATIREENILNRDGIASPVMAVDFNKNPMVTLDVVAVKKEWSLLLYKEGAREGYVIQQPTSSIGKQTYNIRSLVEKAYPAVDFRGIQKIKLWLVAEGDNKTTVIIRDLVLAYDEPYKLRKLIIMIGIILTAVLVLNLVVVWVYKRKMAIR